MWISERRKLAIKESPISISIAGVILGWIVGESPTIQGGVQNRSPIRSPFFRFETSFRIHSVQFSTILHSGCHISVDHGSGAAVEPPGVSTQVMASHIANFEHLLSAPRAAQSADDAYRSLVQLQDVTLQSLKHIAIIMESKTYRQSGSRSMAESKIINNLKTLSSDKTEFRNWNDKLVNAMSLVLGTGGARS